ncbi:MAG: hypothetical protein HOE90_18935 [Bacteriovoracaceae bacterium]|jgi:flagellar protein FliJ|nr:hypothetical protein [Bacteriovoracaceae bacterium]
MNKFKFKLDALLKLRELKEHQCKVELGFLNREIANRKAKIEKLGLSLDESYSSQNEMARVGAKGHEIQFYPMYNQGVRADVDKTLNEIYGLEKRHSEKLEELAKKRGQVKLLGNLKDKEHKKYIKEKNKELERKISENFIIGFSNKEEEI